MIFTHLSLCRPGRPYPLFFFRAAAFHLTSPFSFFPSFFVAKTPRAKASGRFRILQNTAHQCAFGAKTNADTALLLPAPISLRLFSWSANSEGSVAFLDAGRRVLLCQSIIAPPLPMVFLSSHGIANVSCHLAVRQHRSAAQNALIVKSQLFDYSL